MCYNEVYDLKGLKVERFKEDGSRMKILVLKIIAISDITKDLFKRKGCLVLLIRQFAREHLGPAA